MGKIRFIENHKFKVALSFQEKHLSRVRKIAEQLRDALGEENVFFYKWYEDDLDQMNLDEKLRRIYKNADLFVPFFSRGYANSKWCMGEWKIVHDRMGHRQDDSVMAYRFDDVEIEGFTEQDGCLDANVYDPAEIVVSILDRVTRRILPPSGEVFKRILHLSDLNFTPDEFGENGDSTAGRLRHTGQSANIG